MNQEAIFTDIKRIAKLMIDELYKDILGSEDYAAQTIENEEE